MTGMGLPLESSCQSSKVLICGSIFRYEDKAPYVESGKSILGALEVDESEKWVRCHECGYWCAHLGQHVVRSHRILIQQYKTKHGLRKSTRMAAPAIPKFAGGSKFGDERRPLGFRISSETTAKATVSRRASNPEIQNLHNRCVAQIKFRVQELAAKLGRAPLVAELKAEGLHFHYLATYLNAKSLDEILASCGLEGAERKEQHPITSNVKRRLIQVLRDAYAEKRLPLVMEDCKQPFLPSVKTFKRVFGSWMESLSAAGLPISTRSEGAHAMWRRRTGVTAEDAFAQRRDNVA